MVIVEARIFFYSNTMIIVETFAPKEFLYYICSRKQKIKYFLISKSTKIYTWTLWKTRNH